MNTHPYVRAYMGGIVVPTLFLMVIMTGYFVARFILHVPVPIERVIIFPMAVVPNLWGLWNMLYTKLRPGHHLPIGLHGALLPLILLPFGLLIGSAFDLWNTAPGGILYFHRIHVNYALVGLGICGGVAVYYLVWKYFVNFFNEVLGIA
jgi:hypothetical protein